MQVIPEGDTKAIGARLRGVPREAFVDALIAQLSEEARQNPLYTFEKLRNWVEIIAGIFGIAKGYEPDGTVGTYDAFYGAKAPEPVVCDDETWRDVWIGEWKDFVHAAPATSLSVESSARCHYLPGTHETFTRPEHLFAFQKTINEALAQPV
ncbi:hypothetical protein B0A50_04132 [Salinomyces thailandicus]|uniref:Uncharacterized protein n=1 Tax=Salinomyces thailandicus TaxID=706561 RepID=A0A4U0TZW1_9PEZI|nr:hypothetical protein B0A50_04132 [Salinomyces thailandica]